MFEHNADAEELSSNFESYEIITVDYRLRQLLELSSLGAPLEYLSRVHNVFPCECGATVALVKMGHVLRKVNCFRDSSHFCNVRYWNANVLVEHDCAGSQQ